MDRFRPIATGIVGALISSTILGLITVPILYSILDDIRQFLRSVYAGMPFARKVTGEEMVAKLPALPTEVLWELRQVDQFKPGVFGFDTSIIPGVLEQREAEKGRAVELEELVAVGVGGDGKEQRAAMEPAAPAPGAAALRGGESAPL